MDKVVALFGLLVLSGSSWAGSIYKCEDADGRVSFQSQPCGEDQQTTMKRSVAPTLDKGLLSREERYQLDTYVLYMQASALLPRCKVWLGKDAGGLTFRHRRYGEISKTNVDAGRALARDGTEKVAGASIRRFVAAKRRAANALPGNLNQREAHYLCSSIANKLAVAAAGVHNRSSGYEEGDLDPEGND